VGQKAHPKALRLKIIHDFDSTWIADNPKVYAKNVKEDYVIRAYLKDKLKAASLSRVDIQRKAQRIIVVIVTGRPGLVVGRGGQGLDMLRKALQELTGRKDIQVDVLEVNKIEADATLVAQAVAQQIEKRVAYRRVIKQAIQRSMRAGVKGVKIMISGRLGGAEIARTEWSKEGRIPSQTLRADIDYSTWEALTVFGIIGVKVWIFKGEVMPGEEADTNIKAKRNNASNVPNFRGEQSSGIQGVGARKPRTSNPPAGTPGGGSVSREAGYQSRGRQVQPTSSSGNEASSADVVVENETSQETV
jgi:small subunit ribosomal protein S3